jgi:Bacterial membrane protein YfhO
MPKRLSTISVALSSLIFTYIFFAEYLPPYRRIYIPYDLWGYHYPLADYAFQSLKRFSFPAWDVSIYCGQPFAANLQAALFYPPIWILFALSAVHGVLTYAALEAFQFAHIWLGFILFFCWLRNKGLADLACILGAGIFAYSGYAMLQLQHLGLLCGYAWLPLGLWGIDDLTENRNWQGFLKVVASSAACFLAGYPPTWLVLAIYLGTYALFSGKPAVPLKTLLALLASLALSSIQLLPTIEASSLMLRENRYGNGLQDPAFYISYLIPNFFDFGINTDVMTNYGKEYLYLGAPGLFGIGALIRYRRWRPVGPMLAAGCVCLVFLTNPFHAISALVGRFEFLSQVCRDWYFLTGVTAMAAGLAAFGIDQFLSADKRISKAWAIAGAVFAAAWAAYELHAWRPRAPALPSGWWSALDTVAILAIFTICIFAVRGQSGRWRTAMTVVLLLSAGIDYKAFGTSKRFNGHRNFSLPHNYAKDGFSFMNPQAFEALAGHREYRILLDATAPMPVELRHHSLASPQGFDPFIAQRYLDLVKDLGAQFQNSREFTFDSGNDLALQTLAVRYVITTANGPLHASLQSSPAFKLIGKDTDYFQVYEYQKYAEPYSGSGTVTPLNRTPEIRQFRVSSPKTFDFVLKEQFFPGWTAYLDGQTIPIQLWRGAFQSVHVPAGDHSLDFRYQPRTLVIGAWISAASILLLFAMSLIARRVKNGFREL